MTKITRARMENALLFVMLLAVLALVRVITAVNSPEVATTADITDSQATMDAINSAQEIRAERHVFNWGAKWTVYADGQEVGTVQGKNIPVIGDVYSLRTNKGNLVGSESEDTLLLASHKTGMYDWNNGEIGHLDRIFEFVFMKVGIYHGTEEAGTSVKAGSASQELALTLSTTITDTAGNEEWRAERVLYSLVPKITIERASDSDTSVTGMDALWTSLTMSEITERYHNARKIL